MADEKISVIMSTYKEKREWIELSIESILGQTYQNIEFLVIIDDPYNMEIKNIIYRYASKDSRIKIFENEENRGLVYCLNKGLKMATGKYIARMDADDISEKNRIEEELCYLKRHNLDLVGSDIVAINENSDILSKTATKMPVNDRCVNYILRYRNCLLHPTWLGKKELFEKLSGYRDIKYCEDYDFLLRAVSLGARIGNIPKPLLRYRYNYYGISRQNRAEQRCIAYLLSQNRKMINRLSPARINSFPFSKNGQKEIEKMRIYFETSKNALQDKINGNYIEFLKKGIKILRISYGRTSAYITLLTKLLVITERVFTSGDYQNTVFNCG